MIFYFSKELVEAVRFRTHNWKIVGSNPGALYISFYNILSQVKGKNKQTFSIYKHVYNVEFLTLLGTYIN